MTAAQHLSVTPSDILYRNLLAMSYPLFTSGFNTHNPNSTLPFHEVGKRVSMFEGSSLFTPYPPYSVELRLCETGGSRNQKRVAYHTGMHCKDQSDVTAQLS